MSRRPLAVCAIFQNEAAFLQEWIEFHRLVGVEHFFLYDNLSDDDSGKVLAPYCQAGTVTLIPWNVSFEEFAQARAYNDCLQRFGAKFRWLAMLDVDEFLFSPESPCLPAVLQDYEDCPGIVVNWQVYGTSGHVRDPGGLVTEHFLRRAPTQWVRNRRVKSIINPARTTSILNPHFAEYVSGTFAVNENREPVRVSLRSKASGRRWAHLAQRARNRFCRDLVRFVPKAPVDPYLWSTTSLRRVSVSRLRINHYVIKSVEQYVTKKRRHRIPDEEWTGLRVQNDVRFRYHDRNDVYDGILLQYLPDLRRAIESAPGLPQTRTR